MYRRRFIAAVGLTAATALSGCLFGQESPPPRKSNVFGGIEVTDSALRIDIADDPWILSRYEPSADVRTSDSLGSRGQRLDPSGVAEAKGGIFGGGGGGATGRAAGGYSSAPKTIETTYLKAKIAASSAGYIKAAGEFRILRQQYARQKYLDIARDSDVDHRTRFKNVSRAVENYFLGISCGHGMRLVRIGVVFLITPLVPALLYAFGGDLFRTSAGQLSSFQQLITPEGLATLYQIISFSYITFLTIGYGGIAPEGLLARLLAGLEVYLSIILGGIVLYALIKRSEL